jgi:hypothetical protein
MLVGLAVSVVVGGTALCLTLGQPPILPRWVSEESTQWLRDGLERPFSQFVLMLIGAAVAVLVIHACGQVFVGRCAGFRVRSSRFWDLFCLDDYVPVSMDRLAARSKWMVLGGPAADVLAGCAVLVLPSLRGFPFAFIGWIWVFVGLCHLIPFRSRLGLSPGARMWMLLRNGPRAERWLALMQLVKEFDEGVLPEAYSAEALTKAIAVRDESWDTTTAYSLAYSSAFHRHQDAEAARLYEVALRYSAGETPAIREAMMNEAVMWHARRSKRLDLAERWLADMPSKSRLPWGRAPAEAAVLEARGDAEAALRKLDEYERVMRAVFEGRAGAAMATLIERWRSEVRAGPATRSQGPFST